MNNFFQSHRLVIGATIICAGFLFTAAGAKNMSDDVNLLVKQSLMNDDYSEILKNNVAQKSIDVPVDEASTPGLNPVKVGAMVYAHNNGVIK